MEDTMGDVVEVRGGPAEIEWLAGLFPVIHPRSKRVTLMFTDIAGFTTRAAAGGDRAAVRLLRRHDRAVLPAIRERGGRIVKRLGDGVMVVFASPAAAVAAARAMLRAAGPAVRLRIGIHAGEARMREGDLIGHHVNVASRIADRAAGGEILVSDAIRAADGVDVSFRACRPLVIAGRKPIRLFLVRESGR
jgi:class 3 adenylate cyclase